VFPCRRRDKLPATSHGLKDATIDVEQIEAWWQVDPDFNIGIATGAVSNIFVIDVDGGEGELHRLEVEHGELPPTVEAITARGRHIYFRHPGRPIRNSASRFAPGVDVRGDGGYVLAPPSIHPSGREYRWSVDCAGGLAAAPAWVLDRLEAAHSNATTAIPVAEWQRLVSDGIDEGGRNAAVTQLAGYLLRRYIDPFMVLGLLTSWNATHCRPPLDEAEVARCVDSIAGLELKRRRAS